MFKLASILDWALPICLEFVSFMKMNISQTLLLVFFLGIFANPAWASRDVVDVSIEATSEMQSRAGAKQDIFKQAAEKISERYIRQIIGDSKFQKNSEIIKNKIVGNSKKYILYMKGSGFQRESGVAKMIVAMKLSLKTLRQLLLGQGLLYEIEGPPKVVALMSVENRVSGESYSWWADGSASDSPLQRSLLGSFQGSLKKSLGPKGFYTLGAGKASARNALPESLRSADAPTEDLLMVGEFFKSQIVVLGRIQVRKSQKRADVYEIHVRSSALYTSNGRVVGEVIRLFETSAGPINQVVLAKSKEVFGKVASDLTVQIFEAWKSGTFGSSLLRLAVLGELSFGQVKLVKEQLLDKVSQLKTLTERKFTPNRVEFEVDSGGSAEELARILRTSKFAPFQLRVKDWSSDIVRLNISFRQ